MNGQQQKEAIKLLNQCLNFIQIEVFEIEGRNNFAYSNYDTLDRDIEKLFKEIDLKDYL